MHTRLLQNCVLVSLAAGLPAAAYAAHDDSQHGWNVSIIGGYSGGMSGSLTPAENSVIDLSALDPTFTGSGTANIGRVRYGDAFRPGASGGIEAGYGLTDHVSVYTRLTVARFLARNLELGVVSGGGLETPQTLNAQFRDTEDRTWEIGSRYAWTVGQRWRPFIGGGLGVTRPDRIQASLSSAGSSFTARDVDFTDNRRVLAASLTGGADLSLAKTFGLRFSLGAAYAGAPSGAQDPTLGTLGVNVDRDSGARVDYPLEVDAVFKLH